MNRVLLIVLMLAGMTAGRQLAPASALAQDEEIDTFDRTPQDCVALNRVLRTEVIDNRTILFHLRDGTILRNYLPSVCPGLEREERFEYRVSSRRLCRNDTITVIPWDFAAIGATCRLGLFHPMTAEELEELREGPSRIETAPVEVPED